jgi:hypothetical protein
LTDAGSLKASALPTSRQCGTSDLVLMMSSGSFQTLSLTYIDLSESPITIGYLELSVLSPL